MRPVGFMYVSLKSTSFDAHLSYPPSPNEVEYFPISMVFSGIEHDLPRQEYPCLDSLCQKHVSQCLLHRPRYAV